jgi:hypothetical protein
MDRSQMVRRLLEVAGTTYPAEAGVRVSDKPMPQSLALCMHASKPIDAGIAMRAGRELFIDGLETPKSVWNPDRKTTIDAFGRAHYARYDESSATRLTDMAQRVADEYSGDLREISCRVSEDIAAAKPMLKEFKGIGDPGKLGALAPRANALLAAALVRAPLDDDIRQQVANG